MKRQTNIHRCFLKESEHRHILSIYTLLLITASKFKGVCQTSFFLFFSFLFFFFFSSNFIRIIAVACCHYCCYVVILLLCCYIVVMLLYCCYVVILLLCCYIVVMLFSTVCFSDKQGVQSAVLSVHQPRVHRLGAVPDGALSQRPGKTEFITSSPLSIY